MRYSTMEKQPNVYLFRHVLLYHSVPLGEAKWI